MKIVVIRGVFDQACLVLLAMSVPTTMTLKVTQDLKQC